jgi:hypothetical protein
MVENPNDAAVDLVESLDAFRWTMLDAVSGLLSPVWPTGRNPEADDGGHWALASFDRPVSASTKECVFLGLLAASLEFTAIVEVGSGFGYSSSWLAFGLQLASNEASVYTIDDRSESTSGRACEAAMLEIHRRLGVSNVVPVLGRSPDALIGLPVQHGALVFIDGNHHGDQPRLDYHATKGFALNGLLVFHDNDPSRYTVHEAVLAAEREGYCSITLPSSCSITVVGSSTQVELAVELWKVVDRTVRIGLYP